MSKTEIIRAIADYEGRREEDVEKETSDNPDGSFTTNIAVSQFKLVTSGAFGSAPDNLIHWLARQKVRYTDNNNGTYTFHV